MFIEDTYIFQLLSVDERTNDRVRATNNERTNATKEIQNSK